MALKPTDSKIFPIVIAVLIGLLVLAVALIEFGLVGSKRYVSRNLNQCELINYDCEVGKTHFQDIFGCGCR